MFELNGLMSKDRLEEFCRQNHIRKLSLFGSALHDELTSESDIDLLAEFEPDHIPGLFDIARMEIELAKIIGRKVDLRTEGDLSRHFRDKVLHEAEVQYEIG